jgi:hypothetical protein
MEYSRTVMKDEMEGKKQVNEYMGKMNSLIDDERDTYTHP